MDDTSIYRKIENDLYAIASYFTFYNQHFKDITIEDSEREYFSYMRDKYYLPPAFINEIEIVRNQLKTILMPGEELPKINKENITNYDFMDYVTDCYLALKNNTYLKFLKIFKDQTIDMQDENLNRTYHFIQKIFRNLFFIVNIHIKRRNALKQIKYSTKFFPNRLYY